MRAIKVALTSAMVLAVATPVAAAQGTYDVVSCADDAQVEAWTPAFSGPGPSPAGDRCQDGLGFGIDLSAVELVGPLDSSWTFSAPGGTVITSLTLGSVATSNRMPNSEQTFDYALRTGTGEALEASPRLHDWAVGTPSGTRTFDGLAASSLRFAMSCPAEVRCGGSPAVVQIRETRVALRDDAPPTASAWSGRLGGALRADFADSGGGVRTASLLIDGRTVETQQFCREPYTKPVPCPLGGTAVFASPADARHVAVALVDAAGNRTVSGDLPKEPATPTIPTASPLTPLRGVIALTARRTLRATYDQPPVIRGTLRTSEGGAIGAARVAVSGTSGVTTDAQGRFSVRLPKGPSRSVTFAYGDSAQSVKLIVAAPVRLKVSPTKTRNGRSITFRGSVPQAGKARTRVELQAWANGKWVPFKTVALRNERFTARYRFMRTFFAQRYRFRAVIQDDPNFVYAAGRSKEVRVTVRP
jgi:hypothetical protein